jgi:protocatechuate 3,4-dioxygenase beta subunit
MSFHRRQILGFGAALLGSRVLAACGSSLTAVAGGDDGGVGEGGSGLGDAAGDGGAAGEAAATGDAAGGWATGGTASMTGKGSYPDPFAGSTPTSCAATCQLTQGPCWSNQSVEIQDISYGYDGLPMRMQLRVLDESCNPVAGAVIDVWHVSPVGKYSGDDTANENVGFCTGNDSDFTSHIYFRGKQTTDAKGVATFDTCFPGWYSSRTVHVHLTITVGGAASVTTQLCFDDALVTSIVATQPLYSSRGARDTTNTTDTVFHASTYASYELETQQMSDGAMLAYKTIIVRSSTSESLCNG